MTILTYDEENLGNPFGNDSNYVMDDDKPLEVIKAYKAWKHAHDVIKGRWLAFFKKKPSWAYWYAVTVIGERWVEAENVIRKDPKWWDKYNKRFLSHP